MDQSPDPEEDLGFGALSWLQFFFIWRVEPGVNEGNPLKNKWNMRSQHRTVPPIPVLKKKKKKKSLIFEYIGYIGHFLTIKQYLLRITNFAFYIYLFTCPRLS